ncbi:TXND3 protein, partial [Fregata magnificens]|nr:TXND3 protein [Fregata magnificens]
ILFQAIITNQNQWDEMLLTKGVVVIDVYQAWCGPCKAVVSLFRKLKNEFGEDDVLHFAVAEADSIPTLQPFRNKCEPVFLFCVNGKIIAIVRGVNGPLISKKITELVQEEREIAAGQKERAEVLTEQILEFLLHLHEEVVRYSVGIIKPDDVLEGRIEEIKQKTTSLFDIIRGANGRDQRKGWHNEKKKLGECSCGIPNEGEQVTMRSISVKDDSVVLIGFFHAVHELSTILLLIIHYILYTCQWLERTMETESIVNICDVQDSVEDASRQLALFFPNFDKKKTDQKVEKTLALIRPSLLKERRHSIMQRIKDDGFKIAMQKEMILSEEQTREFYQEHENQDYFPVLLEQMTSGPTLVLALTRENAIAHWRDLLGPKTVEEAKKENPNSLRAKYAVNNIPIDQLHGSSTPDDAQKELQFFFPQEHTLALIKPAAAKKHKDDIMQKVKDAGFAISKIKEEALTHEMATQFYKDHKGKPFFEQLVTCMTEGPSVIMILTKENAVEEWRQLMGPADPEVAKETSPESIRAQFAQDILSNAVHGSSN